MNLKFYLKRILNRLKIYPSVLIFNNGRIHYNSKFTFLNDGLFTTHFFEGAQDKLFQKSLEFARSRIKHPLYHEYRLYFATKIILFLVERSRRSGSKFIYLECGVGEGHTFLVSQKYLDLLNKYKDIQSKANFIMMDTYEGVDESILTETEKNSNRKFVTKPYFDSTLEKVKKRLSFKDFNFQFIKGSIPNSLDNLKKAHQSPDFLHIDMNNTFPEVKALEYFIPKMKSGSFILLDDYSFQTAREQREGINDLLEKLKYPFPISLPTGQGLIIT